MPLISILIFADFFAGRRRCRHYGLPLDFHDFDTSSID